MSSWIIKIWIISDNLKTCYLPYLLCFFKVIFTYCLCSVCSFCQRRTGIPGWAWVPPRVFSPLEFWVTRHHLHTVLHCLLWYYRILKSCLTYLLLRWRIYSLFNIWPVFLSPSLSSHLKCVITIVRAYVCACERDFQAPQETWVYTPKLIPYYRTQMDKIVSKFSSPIMKKLIEVQWRME